MAMNAPGLAAGPMPPGVSTEVPQQGIVPFTQAAAPPRTQNSVQNTQPFLTSQQSIVNVLPGTGYFIWLDNFLQIQVSGTGNSSTNSVALAEDAPWSALASITVDDGGPQVVNIDGFGLYLANLYGGSWFMRDQALSADTNIHSALSTGTGTAAGTGQFFLRIPIAINERNYLGLMGNQDRATKYNVRTDLAASSSVYSTAPTVLPNVIIQRTYGYLPVPGPIAADGRRQEQMPPWYSVIHYLSSVRSDALPVASGRVNHYIRNLANAVRTFILVFRSNALRSTANANLPTQIDFKLGTDVLWSESAAERRRIMYSRYGFDAPAGVLVYDCVRDFGMVAGMEMGDQWLYLGNISEAQFEITYPSGWTNANSSLTIITDSLFIPPGVPAQGV